MPFNKTDNVAMYGQADWSGWVKTVPGCTPQQAQRIAVADPAIRFFFYCREYMVLTNPGWPEPRSFQPGDAVFFSGEPWFGSAPQCDSYVKNGVAVAYIGNLSSGPTSPLVAAKYSTAQGLNSVDVVSLFAANLNLSLSSDLIRLAPSVPVPTGGTLAVAHEQYVQVFQQSVAALQERGIAVLLSFLNNWDAAGWSNFDPDTAEGQTDAWNFALQLQQVVETYGFDGIDIDDEYAQPDKAIPASLAMVTSMIRQLMPDKILSKALWEDSGYFGPTYKGSGLSQTLTCGWQMSYGDSPQYDLAPYVEAGMAPEALAYGFQAGHGGDPGPAIQWLKSNGYMGFMVYDFENPDNQALMGQLIGDWCGPGNWNASS